MVNVEEELPVVGMITEAVQATRMQRTPMATSLGIADNLALD